MILSPQKIIQLYEHCQTLIKYLPNSARVTLVSRGRNYFMQQFLAHSPVTTFIPAENLAVNLWGIKFRSNLSNAAGMFKNGEAYDFMASIGAGAYIGGTSTFNPRAGNTKDEIKLPFVNLSKSFAALNWLGLPNLGDAKLSSQLITANKVDGCPIGWSLMRSPDFAESDGIIKLVESLWRYHDNLQIDFIEINESCPNIKVSSDNIIQRLKFISKEFLAKRRRHLPVIVKLSNDLSFRALDELLPQLVIFGYDGITLGNTSNNYNELINAIASDERAFFKYFTAKFGGGISGQPLRDISLALCGYAADILAKLEPDREFHIIRSGGVSTLADLELSRSNGVSFNQWYTGFFSNYATSGDAIYRKLFTQ